jgi:flagellar motor switch protein FliN
MSDQTASDPATAVAATSPATTARDPSGATEPATLERATGDRLSAIYDIPVQLAAVLGRTTMPVNQLLRLGRGAVVELDRKVGEPIDIYVNNRLVARGEVLIVDDHLGITMTEIIKSDS